MKQTQNFTEGRIFAPLIRFALPVPWLMSRQVPVSLLHIGLAAPASTVVQIILCGGYFAILLRKRR